MYLICEEGVLALASLPVLLPVLPVPPVLAVPPVFSLLPVLPVCLSEEGGGVEDPSFSGTASSPAKAGKKF
jgi:hypothetical protein